MEDKTKGRKPKCNHWRVAALISI